LIETEVKLRVGDRAAIRRQLGKLGFRVANRRTLEINTVFDTPAGSLRRERKLLRLRVAGGRCILAFKGPPSVSRYKSREEIESRVEDAEALRGVLQGLGYAPVFRYEKYRTEYTRGGEPGHAMLDETPIGDFLELEGAPRWIDRAARELERSPADYITASYGALYQQYCLIQGVKSGNMVFGT
jgi:adenylate cyclase, class 2